VQLTILPSKPASDSRRQSATLIAARAIALFFGGFSLLNVLGDLRHPGFDASLWWIDLRILPSPLPVIFLLEHFLFR